MNCFCEIETDGHTARCGDTLYCDTGCNSNADCAQYGANGGVCVYAQECDGAPGCLTDDTCPVSSPAKRELKKVFVDAERKKLRIVRK